MGEGRSRAIIGEGEEQEAVEDREIEEEGKEELIG